MLESENIHIGSHIEKTPLRNNQAEKTKETQTDKTAERLKKACKDFESIFITHLLKTMRSSSNESGLFGKGLGGEFYQGILEAEVAQKVAHSDGIGLAEILYKSFINRGTLRGTENKNQSLDARTLSPLTTELLFKRVHAYNEIIESASNQIGVSRSLIYAVIGQESAGYEYAISAKGARGLMQLMEETADCLGITDIFDPRENIIAGTRYLKQLLDEHNGDMKLALAAYNAGPNTVKQYGGIPPYKETRHYISRVLDLSERFKTMLENNQSD